MQGEMLPVGNYIPLLVMDLLLLINQMPDCLPLIDLTLALTDLTIELTLASRTFTSTPVFNLGFSVSPKKTNRIIFTYFNYL